MDSATLPADWVSFGPPHYEASVTEHLHSATVFVACNPWQPLDSKVTWVAVLKGGWVVSPSVYMRRPGPALKYKCALQVERELYISPSFRQQHASHWLLLLEVMNCPNQTHNWKLMLDAVVFAQKKAPPSNYKAARVLALLSTEEFEHPANAVPHVFSLMKFIEFISIRDDARTSFGLSNM